MSGHTPTPWAVETTTYASGPIARIYPVVAQTEENASAITYLTLRPEEVEANADLIVRAVNNHDALLTALSNIAGGCNIAGLADALLQGNATSAIIIIQQYAREALSAAKGAA